MIMSQDICSDNKNIFLSSLDKKCRLSPCLSCAWASSATLSCSDRLSIDTALSVPFLLLLLHFLLDFFSFLHSFCSIFVSTPFVSDAASFFACNLSLLFLPLNGHIVLMFCRMCCCNPSIQLPNLIREIGARCRNFPRLLRTVVFMNCERGTTSVTLSLARIQQ